MKTAPLSNAVSRLDRIPITLVLTLFGFLAYGNAVNHPFVHDDVVFIELNPYIADLNPKNIFIQTAVPQETFPLVNQYYRPLLEVVNRILYALVRLNPHGFHLFNVLLHIGNAVLVQRFVRLLTGPSAWLPSVTALLFLLHPVQSEAVACVAGISNLVFAFLCLLSFFLYVKSAETQAQKQNLFMYTFSLAAFLCALLSKEQSVVLPFLIIGYEFCFSPVSRKSARRILRRVSWFFIGAGGYFLLRTVLFGAALSPVMDSKGELALRLLAIPRSLLTYLRIIGWPYDLHYYRNQDILLPWVGPAVTLLLLAVVVWHLVRKAPDPQKRRMVFGLAWFFISILPTLNIVPLVNEYSKILTADHFLYFPVIGVWLFVLAPVQMWINRKPGGRRRMACMGAFVILAAVSLGMTRYQNTFWRGEVPLFERMIRFEKDFGRGHMLLARAYANEGRMAQAIVHDKKALEIMQGYLQNVTYDKARRFYVLFIKDICHHLGYNYEVIGEPGKALLYYKQALALEPDNARLLYAVGLNYLKVNEVRGAIPYFQRAVALDENNLMALNSLAVCYREIGEDDEAEKYLRAVAAKDSRSVSARQNLEEFLREKHKEQ